MQVFDVKADLSWCVLGDDEEDAQRGSHELLFSNPDAPVPFSYFNMLRQHRVWCSRNTCAENRIRKNQPKTKAAASKKSAENEVGSPRGLPDLPLSPTKDSDVAAVSRSCVAATSAASHEVELLYRVL